MPTNKKEIIKLTQKLAENPGSKFFIPLAEEYANAELYDEAIDTLKKGLAEHPEYLSGKVSLGKVYMKKGMMEFAKSAFEDVLKQNPENLLCHRKLAFVYLKTGKLAEARSSCDKVLALNHKDKEMISIMESIQEREIELNSAPDEAGTEQVAEVIQDSSLYESALGDGVESGSIGLDESEIIAAASKGSSTTSVREYIDFPVGGEHDRSDDIEVEDKDTIRRLHEVSGTAIPAGQEIEKLKNFVQDKVEFSAADEEYNSGEAALLKEKLVKDSGESEEISMLAEAIQNEELNGSDSMDDESDHVDEITSASIAELYIQQGDNSKGIDVYRKIVDADPENDVACGRLNELLKQNLGEIESVLSEEGEETDDEMPVHSDSDDTSSKVAGVIKNVKERKIDRLKAFLNKVKKRGL